jgi:putative membrane protein
MMFGYDQDFGAWGWVLMSLSMVAFWALVIAGIVAAVRYFGAVPDRADWPVPRTPQDVLAERYARGEIEEDEYQRRLKTLQDAISTTSTPASRG